MSGEGTGYLAAAETWDLLLRVMVSVGQNQRAQPESCLEGSGEAGVGHGGDGRSGWCVELQLVFNFCIKKKIAFLFSFFYPKYLGCKIKKKKRHYLD